MRSFPPLLDHLGQLGKSQSQDIHTHTVGGNWRKPTDMERSGTGDCAKGISKPLAESAFICSIFPPSFPAASQGEVVARNGLLIGRGLTGHV